VAAAGSEPHKYTGSGADTAAPGVAEREVGNEEYWEEN